MRNTICIVTFRDEEMPEVFGPFLDTDAARAWSREHERLAFQHDSPRRPVNYRITRTSSPVIGLASMGRLFPRPC